MSIPKLTIEDAKDSLLYLLQHSKVAMQELKSLEKSALVALRGIGENKLDTERFRSAIDNIKKTGKLSSESWRVSIGEIKNSTKAAMQHLIDAKVQRRSIAQLGTMQS